MESKSTLIQGGGLCHVWRNPDDSFRHLLLQLNSDCELDTSPGIVIISDEYYRHAHATIVNNLQKELPSLLNQIEGKPIVYWWPEEDDQELKRIASGLTKYPIFVG